MQLESKVNECSKKFQRDVLEGLLYNKKFDNLNLRQWRTLNYEKIKEGLTHAYKDLEAFDEDIEIKVDAHCKEIQKSLELLVSPKDTKTILKI